MNSSRDTHAYSDLIDAGVECVRTVCTWLEVAGEVDFEG